MGYVACLGQIPEETAHVLQNLVSANGLTAHTKNQFTRNMLMFSHLMWGKQS